MSDAVTHRQKITAPMRDAVMWVRRVALDAAGAKDAMIAANAGHSGLSDLETAARLLVRHEEGSIAREEVAALAGLEIGHEAEHDLGVAEQEEVHNVPVVGQQGMVQGFLARQLASPTGRLP